MTHHPYRRLGHEMVQNWGRETDASVGDIIRKFSNEEKTIALLCTVASELRALNANPRLKREPVDPYQDDKPGSHYMADAMIASQTSKMLLAEMGWGLLSTRARNTLARLVINVEKYDGRTATRADLTHARLDEIRSCGEATINEIIKWEKSHK